jgi:hypothetical protein
MQISPLVIGIIQCIIVSYLFHEKEWLDPWEDITWALPIPPSHHLPTREVKKERLSHLTPQASPREDLLCAPHA